MGGYEKILRAAMEDEGKIVEIKREDIIRKILKLKEESENKPDSINLHLKNVDKFVLLNSLTERDYSAFKMAFNNEWTEKSKDFRDYIEEVLEWEEREKMDSGKSPKLIAR